MILNKDTMSSLTENYKDKTTEIGGFVKKNGEVVVCENVHPNPIDNVAFSIGDLKRLEQDDVLATFHTHLGGKNLSHEDYLAFRNWCEIYHLIIGADGVRCYKVNERGNVVVEDLQIAD